eukprot:XP_008186494.1 PREDICTED: gastrula zinc finger protein XlCGF62.1-like [Acyrthosiphon pisum]
MAFNGFNQRKLELAIDQLKRKVCQVTLPGTANPTTSTIVENPSSSSSSTPSTSLLWKIFDEQYEICQTSINPTAAGIIELDRKRLCVTATSVPCERLFSKAVLNCEYSSTEDKSSDEKSEGSIEDEVTYKCTYPGCVKSYKKQRWCSKHLDSHFDRHVCQKCNKVLSSKGTLKRHIKMHTDKRTKFKCEICNRTFFHESDLKYHQKTIHEDNSSIKCTLCEKTYSTKKLLKNHNEFVHLNLKKYRCTECGMFFGMSITLHRHKKKVIY